MIDDHTRREMESFAAHLVGLGVFLVLAAALIGAVWLASAKPAAQASFGTTPNNKAIGP